MLRFLPRFLGAGLRRRSSWWVLLLPSEENARHFRLAVGGQLPLPGRLAHHAAKQAAHSHLFHLHNSKDFFWGGLKEEFDGLMLLNLLNLFLNLFLINKNLNRQGPL
jgi:hypothetical protein